MENHALVLVFRIGIEFWGGRGLATHSPKINLPVLLSAKLISMIILKAACITATD